MAIGDSGRLRKTACAAGKACRRRRRRRRKLGSELAANMLVNLKIHSYTNGFGACSEVFS